MVHLPPFSLDPDFTMKALASSKHHDFLARGFGVSDSPSSPSSHMGNGIIILNVVTNPCTPFPP